MDKVEKERLEKSIAEGKDAISKGLIIDPEAVGQLYRMIGYYTEKIKKEYKEEKPMEHIEIAGYNGTWYSIDEMETEQHGKIYLMESEQYGDEAACIIVDANLKILVEDVWNGFDDYTEAFSD